MSGSSLHEVGHHGVPLGRGEQGGLRLVEAPLEPVGDRFPQFRPQTDVRKFSHENFGSHLGGEGAVPGLQEMNPLEVALLVVVEYRIDPIGIVQ